MIVFFRLRMGRILFGKNFLERESLTKGTLKLFFITFNYLIQPNILQVVFDFINCSIAASLVCYSAFEFSSQSSFAIISWMKQGLWPATGENFFLFCKAILAFCNVKFELTMFSFIKFVCIRNSETFKLKHFNRLCFHMLTPNALMNRM